jgi:hypothetical protein
MPKKQSSPLDATHQKLMKKRERKKSGGDKKFGRNKVKCANYRARVGKPAGKGQPGQKKH